MAVPFIKDCITAVLNNIEKVEGYNHAHIVYMLDEICRDCVDFGIQEDVTSRVLEAYAVFKCQQDYKEASSCSQYQAPVCVTGAVGRPRLDVTESQLLFFIGKKMSIRI